MKVKSESEVTQSCPTLSDPMDCSLLGSSIHGIFQARVLEWVAKSRPWSIPTQNRVASSSLGLISVPEMEAKSLGAQCRIPIRFAALWIYRGLGPTQVFEDVWYGREYHTRFRKMLHGSHGKHGMNTTKGAQPSPPHTFFFSSLTEVELMKWICVYLSCMIWPFDRHIHCEIFITFQSSTHPSIPSFHVLYGDNTRFTLLANLKYVVIQKNLLQLECCT